MGVIVPVRSDKGTVVAALLIRGFDMYKDFDTLFKEASDTSGLDIYAVDRRGVMVTASPRAIKAARLVELELRPDAVAAQLRVSDPGFVLHPQTTSDKCKGRHCP